MATEEDPEREPDSARSELDRRFGEIVAGWDSPAGSTPSEDTQAPRPSESAEVNPPLRFEPPHNQNDAENQGSESWREWAGDDDEDHFVPGPTEPLPAGDLHFWGIVIGLTLGPVLLFLSAAFEVLPMFPWGLFGTVATVGGFVLLVLRSPRRRGYDDSSGAQV